MITEPITRDGVVDAIIDIVSTLLPAYAGAGHPANQKDFAVPATPFFTVFVTSQEGSRVMNIGKASDANGNPTPSPTCISNQMLSEESAMCSIQFFRNGASVNVEKLKTLFGGLTANDLWNQANISTGIPKLMHLPAIINDVFEDRAGLQFDIVFPHSENEIVQGAINAPGVTLSEGL